MTMCPLLRSISLRLPALLMSAMLATPLLAQQFSITAGSITTCVGVLEDSGGPAAPYNNNENFTVVICADTPGDGISLNWLIFNLSGAQPNPDRIRIWDGDNTGETFLGEYTGNGLQGLVVSATPANSTGCLTVQFISNGTGTGNFAASITCFTPCDRPEAIASMSEAAPALICVGEQISFDGTASTAAPGFNIVSYEWEFDDGSTAAGPTASHSFTEPGEYIVQLNLVDNNGCVNSNVVDLQVLVSTTPVFTGTIESVVTCFGASVDLVGVVTPVTWTGLPDANFGEGVFLPDDVGQPFTSSLSFTQFEPGQTLNDIGDILSICVEMEHSFMGDLVLQVYCPNGQTLIFHQQGGGGTYLGSPNDTDSNTNPVIGECWNYCWSPTATNGTWVDNSNAGAANTTTAGTPPAQSLNPGTYEPVGTFNSLLGCPLNGEWTYQSTDLWGADNGFICSWSINFDPSIIPDVTQFTPSINGASVDSAGWTGPFLTADPNNASIATADITTPGTYDYVYSATDNFGCTYDTTITVTVEPQMVIDAGPTVTLCNDPVPMAGEIVANGPPEDCNYQIELEDTWGDGWNGAQLTVTVAGVSNTYTMTAPSPQFISIPVSSGQTFVVSFAPGAFNNEHSFAVYNGTGGLLYQSPLGPATGVAYNGIVDCSGGVSNTVWSWSPVTGLTDPSDPETDVYVTSPTWYYLTAYPTGNPDCAVIDSVQVIPDPSIDAGLSAVLSFCAGTPDFLMTDSLLGTPDATGVWTNGAGAVVPGLFQTLSTPGGQYTYTVTSPSGCVATSTLNITVIPLDDPTCCGIPDAGLPDTSCDLTIDLSATPGNTGVGQWFGPVGASFADPFSAITTVTVQPGMGGAHWFYWRENDGAFCNTVDSVQMTFTDAIVIDFNANDAVCEGNCDGNAEALVSGGNAAVAMNFQWSNGVAGAGADQITNLCPDEYSVTVTDDNGCTASATVLIELPDPGIDAGISTTLEFCAGTPDFLMTDSLLGTPDANGVWTDGAGATVPGLFETLTTPGGQYTYTVTSAAGCQVFSTLDITVIPADDPVCCGVPDAGLPLLSCNLSIALSATPGNTGVGRWFGPAGAVFDDAFAPATSVTLQPGMGGQHWFYWRENDGAFCNTVDSVLMTFTDPLTIDFTTSDAVCYTYCDGNAQALVGGGNAAVALDYNWSTGVAGPGADQISDLCAGDYTVTVTDDNGCAITSSVTISEPPLLEISSLTFEPVTCSGECSGRVIVDDARAVSYSYDNASTWSASSVLEDACEQPYLVWIRDQAGCLGSRLVVVTGPPPVVSGFLWGPQPANINAPSIRFINTSTGAERYTWDIAGLMSTTEENPTYVFSDREPGNYEVCMVAYNMNNCADTTCQTVVIEDILFTYIPNSFTPDGDGLNDTWGMSVNIASITSFELSIYDRWGGVILTSTDPLMQWNGAAQNSGDILPQGVYTYRITYEVKETQTRKELMGHVTLIR